jgi:tetratricopeptide (TPR) repeat protein
MPDVAKLKKKAAEFEQKKQFDKALAVYVEILDGFDASSDDDVDVGLFNRVGDLYLKQGSVGDAVDYYEKAVDRYADGGFFNNAIALCNKILRNSPGRASVYYKLGKISAQKGFKGDAKKNFLEYADRMQSAGKTDEAFRALKEFADLCPDQDDIRLMLADQFSKKGRGVEAIEQLQSLYERYMHEGRGVEAGAAVDRMKAIDPNVEPHVGRDAPRRGRDDLVFLDLNDSSSRRNASFTKRATLGLDVIEPGDRTPRAQEAIARPTPAVAAAPAPTPDVLETPMLEPEVLDGVTRAAEFERTDDAVTDGGLLDGLETMSFTAPEPSETSASLVDFEPTTLTPQSSDAIADAQEESEHEPLAFDLPEARTPTPARPSERIEHIADLDVDFAAIAFEEEPPPRLHSTRGLLTGLPMLVDEDGLEADSRSEAKARDVERPDDDAPIGGDLELIMPEGTPAAGTPILEIEFQGPALGDIRVTDVPPIEQPEGTDNADERDLATPPAARRGSTMMAEQSVELLQALCEADPEDLLLRRRLAEAMLESGDREGGLRELETAMVSFERADDLAAAAMVADEIVLLNPASVRHHQKRVEYAFRTNERGRLIEAYLQLADALFRAGQVEKSRAIYQRVIDLSPDDLRAQAALETFPPTEPEPAPIPAPKGRQTVQAPRVTMPAPAPTAAAASMDSEFVNLGDWLRDDEAPKDTRMIVEEKEPTGDEEADFQDMLRKFKQGISENVDEEDHQSHYDLGVAYKEMGLLDEAIAEFQKALRAPTSRVPTYEALGQCFMEKEQYPMAATVLSRALHERDVNEDQLVGVLYLLGRCAEQRGQRDAAIEYYQRVFVIDIQFRDVGDRLAAVEGASS